MTTMSPVKTIRRAALAACLAALCLPAANAQKETPAPAEKKKFTYQELGRAPEKARKRTNPLENNADAPAAGRKIYEKHCADCHGQDASGTNKAPSLRAREVQEAAPGAIFWLITNGVVRRGMPVWSNLPEPQRWQIVRYLKSLGSPEAPAKSASNPPSR